MPTAWFLGGTVAPILLMLSPLVVIATSGCADWTPTARMAKADGQAPCSRPRLPLM